MLQLWSHKFCIKTPSFLVPGNIFDSLQPGMRGDDKFMHMHVRHPLGSLLGAIQMDDAYVSWLGLWQGPTNDVII